MAMAHPGTRYLVAFFAVSVCTVAHPGVSTGGNSFWRPAANQRFGSYGYPLAYNGPHKNRTPIPSPDYWQKGVHYTDVWTLDYADALVPYYTRPARFPNALYVLFGQSYSQNYNADGMPSLSDIVDMTTLTKVVESTEAVFHEGPVWIESTNELYFSSNRFTDSSGGQSIRISKVNVGIPNPPVVTVNTNPPILMANGAAKTNAKEVVYCSQGFGTTSGALMRLNVETLVATKTPLNPNLDLSSPNDVMLNDQYDGYFFTDPPYGYYQNFRVKNTLSPSVYFADRKTLQVTRIWEFAANNRPNGLSPSLDGTRLYVADSGFQIGNGTTDSTVPTVVHVFAMSKGSNGVPVLTKMDPISLSGVGTPDTVKVDDKGNLYVTVDGGVRVYTPTGNYIGTIAVPTSGSVANIAWAGKKLFILAEKALYSVQLKNGEAPLHDISNTNW